MRHLKSQKHLLNKKSMSNTSSVKCVLMPDRISNTLHAPEALYVNGHINPLVFINGLSHGLFDIGHHSL